MSFNRETTVPGVSTIKLIKRLKEQKYKIQLLYIGVESVDICKQRVAKRVLDGGHGIPEDIIEMRFNIINKRVAEILDLCDSIQFYDNTFENIQLVGYKDNDKLVKLIDNCKWLNEIIDEYQLTNNNQWGSF